MQVGYVQFRGNGYIIEDFLDKITVPPNWKKVCLRYGDHLHCYDVSVISSRVDSRTLDTEYVNRGGYIREPFNVSFLVGELHSFPCHKHTSHGPYKLLAGIIYWIVFMETHDALEFIRLPGQIGFDPHMSDNDRIIRSSASALAEEVSKGRCDQIRSLI